MDRSFWLAATILLAVATAFRFYKLGAKPFWIDEAHDWFCVNNGSLIEQAPYQMFVILYLILQNIITAITKTEIGFRLLSAISSSTTVLLVMIVVRKVASLRASILTGFFLAFSMSDIYYAQEARQYAFANMLAVMTTLAWLHYIKKQTALSRMLFLFSAVSAILSSLSSLFVVGIELALLLVWRFSDAQTMTSLERIRTNIKRLKMTPVLLVIGAVALLVILSTHYFASFYLGECVRGAYSYSALGPFAQALELSRYLAGDGTALWTILFVGFFIGCAVLFPTKRRSWNFAFVLPSVSILCSIIAFLFHWLTFKATVRYVLIVLPFLVSTWAIGVDRLFARLHRFKLLETVLVICLIFSVAFLSLIQLKKYYSSPVKWFWGIDYRNAFLELCEQMGDEDAIVSIDWLSFSNRYYFSHPCNTTYAGSGKDKVLKQIYLFHNSGVAKLVLDIGEILEDDPNNKSAFALDISELAFQSEHRMPWRIKRFWIVMPALGSFPPNDLIQWWKKDPNQYVNAELFFPDGSFIRRKEALTIAIIPNSSEDLEVFNPIRLVGQVKQIVGSVAR